MAYEFKKLSEVEALENVPEEATVLAEVGGAIKRVPGEGLGGSGKIPEFDLSAMGLPNIPVDGTTVSVSCDTTEIIEAMAKGLIKITVNGQVSSDSIFPMKAVAAPMYATLTDTYVLGFTATFAGTLMTGVFQIYVGRIDAQIYILASATT